MVSGVWRGSRWIAPAVLFALTVGFYWKLALTGQYLWFDHPDMAYIELPRLQYQAYAIARGRFPLWDPFVWSGQPLIGQTQPGPLFPLNLLFFLMRPLEDGYLSVAWLNWYYAIVHFLAAVFCHALCRDWGLSRTAAVFAGCVFSFGGFFGTVPWLDVFNGAFWTPLILLYQFRAVRGGRPLRSSALCGLFLGLAWLSGHHEIPLLVSVAVAANWAWNSWRRPALLRYAAVSVLVAGAVSAAQLWPTIEFGRLSVRWVGVNQPAAWTDRVPYTVHTVYSLPARGILQTLLPSSATHADTSPFFGAAVVALAALGLCARWRTPAVRWLAVVGAISLVYAMGALSPLHGVLYALFSPLAKARVTVRALHVTGLAIAVLAGFGMAALLARESMGWVRRIAMAAAVYGLALIAHGGWSIVNGHEVDDRIALNGFAALTVAIVWAAWRTDHIGRAAVAVAMFAAALMELTALTSKQFPHRFEGEPLKFAKRLFANRDLARRLHDEPQPIRVSVDEADLPENFGDWNRVEVLQGYVAGVPWNLVRIGLHTERMQQLFGVTHWLSRKPANARQVDIHEGVSGVKIFRNPDPLPRARSVHRAIETKDVAELDMRIQDPTVDLRTTVVMMGRAPTLETCGGEDKVALPRHNSDRVTISANMACRGLVVLGDPYFPGWSAKIDGQPAEILEVYGALRGVVVDSGAHTVEMIYRPVSVIGGAAITLAGLLAVAALCLVEKRRARLRISCEYAHADRSSRTAAE